MSPLSSLPYTSSYSVVTGSASSSVDYKSRPSRDSSDGLAPPAVTEARATTKASGEPPSEAGDQAVRAGDETEATREARKNSDPEASSQKAGGLDEAELEELTELKARDLEVRAHEAAHQAVGGQYAGAMSFTYQRGPDGAQYAVGGEVSIDVSPVNGDPQATIEKMRVVRAAAMAPAEPSGQDRAVAAQAMQVMLQAQSEIASGQGAQAEEPVSDSKESSASSPDDTSSQQSSSGLLPRASEQARSTYQDVAGYGAAAASSSDGFLPISA
ncbi:putative metalloprotease CJM1_0395 family protein [Marinobacter sp. ANT_B65]|uniref:putative metalloprotease CJM1_0395 family protein n=1 Tax=Marinobacter sp. ANT_B65 TaxID=2039467 RepID=UPI001D0D13D3